MNSSITGTLARSVHSSLRCFSAQAGFVCFQRGRAASGTIREARDHVKRMGGVMVAETARSCAEQLARFFPRALPVRIAVQITALRPGQARLRERIVVEYSASEHAIFRCTLPLEFDDRISVEQDGDGKTAEAEVIAVQYHEGSKAVAVRFLKGSCDWMVQP